MGKEKAIPIIAMVVLFIGIFSTIYVDANQVEKDTIEIYGRNFSLDQLFSDGVERTIETDEGEKTGISLEDIIINVGIGCVQCHDYTIKAKDGYQQTVSWDILKTGIITDHNRVFFPDTAHSFWVRDVIEIEVI
ncbi:hypothetical protein AYK21_03170 [Thermoplasmatales archaeon SG8-52-2]|nr:MAG: hypothetical protein AYK21_03170 [Thermoplasmatales archaeon SG8-52-2]